MLVIHLDHGPPPGDVYVGSLFQLKAEDEITSDIFSPHPGLCVSVCVCACVFPHASTHMCSCL